MGTADYCFSFFRKPIQNIEPIRAVGIVDVYRYITGHYAQPQTEALRLMATKAVTNCIKATGLPLVDMSGSDVARSCFLPHDPQAYINPKYKDDVKENIFRPRLGECPF